MIETNIPSKALQKWLHANSEKIAGISHEGGYCDNNGRECKKYDLVLADGYEFPGWVGTRKILIERNANDVLKYLKAIIEVDTSGAYTKRL